MHRLGHRISGRLASSTRPSCQTRGLLTGDSERDRWLISCPFHLETARQLASASVGSVSLRLRASPLRTPSARRSMRFPHSVRRTPAQPRFYIEWSDGNGAAIRLRPR